MTSGAGSRRKGHQFERDVANMFRDHFGDEVKRGWQAARGDAEPDVVVPGLWIECKRGKRTNVKAALRQAIEDSDGRGMPVAICKDDQEEATATLRLEDFVALFESSMTRPRMGLGGFNI